MRFIHGVTGCRKGIGSKEIESDDEVCVRVVDCSDGFIALRVGIHPESARMTPEEARHVARLLTDAADRADAVQ